MKVDAMEISVFDNVIDRQKLFTTKVIIEYWPFAVRPIPPIISRFSLSDAVLGSTASGPL